MKSTAKICLVAAGVLVSLASTGCDKPTDRDTPTSSRSSAMDPGPELSEELRRHTGLSALPRVEDRAAFKASLKRHRPGQAGAILLNVAVDENGFVTAVDEAPRQPGNQPRAVLVEKTPDGRRIERPLVVRHVPALLAAARKVMREVRFIPAERDGKAVAYTLRMTLAFD